MRIAFLGTRGIPACYSGFETFVEQVAVRMARLGHEVSVYNRIPFNKFRGREYQGVRLFHLPTIPTKGTDTITHTALSTLHTLLRKTDIAYYCGVGNSLLSFLPKIRGTRTVVNVDGADFARAKWSGFGKWWLRKSEKWASDLADVVIGDSRTIVKRYQEEYGREAVFIPYGANVVREDPGRSWLDQLQIEPGCYFLYVSRLTPENAADLTLEAYLSSGSDLSMVVVGDAPYQGAYIDRLRMLAKKSEKIRMTGFVFGEGYRQLSYHARAFICPTAIDATRPVLLDQMGFGNCIIARDTPGNVEVLGDTGLYFHDADPMNTLAARIAEVGSDPSMAKRLGEETQNRVAEFYDWDVVTRQYLDLFEGLIARSA